MSYEFPLWPPSREYVCPPDAGPAWLKEFDARLDMAELEENLNLSPEERLQKHDQIRDDFLKHEAFLDKLQRGAKFISNYHVHPR
jgi:hypothetical protein